MYVGGAGHPYIMQDGRDGDIEPAYITNLCDGSVIGFKYFDCKGLTAFGIKTRVYAHGNVKIKTRWDDTRWCTFDISGIFRYRSSRFEVIYFCVLIRKYKITGMYESSIVWIHTSLFNIKAGAETSEAILLYPLHPKTTAYPQE